MTDRIKITRVAEMTGLSPKEVLRLAQKGNIPSAAFFGPRLVTFREPAIREWLPYFRAADHVVAEQPGRFGLIYVIQGVAGSPIKVGFSTPTALLGRLVTLQTGNPCQLRIIAQSAGHMRDEKTAHAALAQHRLVGEWFAWAPETAAFVEALPRGIGAALAAARRETVQ